MEINSNFCESTSHRKAKVETVFIYEPVNDWSYSHHQSITFFKGKFYAIWSNGRRNEDDPEQRVLISSSEDFYSWTDPTPLVDSKQGEHSSLVLTAAGFHQNEDTLVAYLGKYEYELDYLKRNQVQKDGYLSIKMPKPTDRRTRGCMGHMGTELWAISKKRQESWGNLENLNLPIVPNHGPQKTHSGRLIISGNVSYPYTDERSGLADWAMSGIYPSNMDPVYDDAEAFWVVKEMRGWDVGLCEGSFYQTEDNVIHMLLRSLTSYLWVTESSDDGITWSDPKPTKFTDNNTKFHFGSLPDGRVYYVGCPDPEGSRTPLVMSVSKDGRNFDRHLILGSDEYVSKREGRAKGGQYGYPHTLVHDGYIYIIISRCKEAVQVIRISLSELG